MTTDELEYYKNLVLYFKIGIVILILGISIAAYYFYRIYKNKKPENIYSDMLKMLVNEYIKPGLITSKEFGSLFHLLCQMSNYMGIYKEHIFKATKDFHENGRYSYESSFNDIELEQKEKEKEKTIVEVESEIIKQLEER